MLQIMGNVACILTSSCMLAFVVLHMGTCDYSISNRQACCKSWLRKAALRSSFITMGSMPCCHAYLICIFFPSNHGKKSSYAALSTITSLGDTSDWALEASGQMLEAYSGYPGVGNFKQ